MRCVPQKGVSPAVLRLAVGTPTAGCSQRSWDALAEGPGCCTPTLPPDTPTEATTEGGLSLSPYGKLTPTASASPQAKR